PASGLPASCGSDVMVGGMLATTQCHHPLLVGASGSNMVSTNDLVPSGAPSQLRAGDRFSAPSPLLLAHAGSGPLCSKSGLVRVKLGTSGRRQFGSLAIVSSHPRGVGRPYRHCARGCLGAPE